MQERIILFDLDGTLTDSGPGIMKASQFALRAYGVERDWQELDFFVGPPLDETFGQFMPKEDIPGAIDQFRVYYHDVGWLENEPYPGVREMLDTLQKNGFRLFVATSKLESMAVQVLEHFGLAPYFEAICGAPGDNTQAGKKVNVIRAALQKAGFNVVGERGGGGFIRIEKFDAKADGYLESILPSLENPTSYTRSKQIICHLVDDGVISKDEGNLLSAATCDKALTAPQHVADVIRSNILKETIIQILKR